MTRSSHEDNEDNDSYVDSPVDSPVSAANAANSAALAGSASPTGPTGPDAAAVADLRAADSASAARAVSHELRCLEAAEGVRVLLAVESGSRAWGFESPDSDFDVRLVYVRPIEYYLRLQSTRDVLEWRLDEVLDVSGWDLDKALRLMRGANPSLFEWLASPIVYAEDPARALAGFLTHELDTTARVIPGAATMYGFIPDMEEAASALEAVIAEVAPAAPAPPAAQRG